MRASQSDALLQFLAMRNPYIWEVIGGGPLGQYGAVALNPQPLPPGEVGTVLVSVLAERAVLGGGYGSFMEDIDDWCGTGWPHFVPKPKGGGPDPSPWQVFLGAAVAATVLAHGLDGKDAEQVSAGAGKLFQQAQQLGR